MSVNLAFSTFVSSSAASGTPTMIYDPVSTAGVGLSTETSTEVGAPIPIYRGISGGSYVYSEGNPPGGASFITIIGYK